MSTPAHVSPRNTSVAAAHATLIDAPRKSRRPCTCEGIKILGLTTGYTRDIMAEITVAASQGFAPDCLVCTGDTPDGCPTPFMLHCAIKPTIRRSALPRA